MLMPRGEKNHLRSQPKKLKWRYCHKSFFLCFTYLWLLMALYMFRRRNVWWKWARKRWLKLHRRPHQRLPLNHHLNPLQRMTKPRNSILIHFFYPSYHDVHWLECIWWWLLPIFTLTVFCSHNSAPAAKTRAVKKWHWLFDSFFFCVCHNNNSPTPMHQVHDTLFFMIRLVIYIFLLFFLHCLCHLGRA